MSCEIDEQLRYMIKSNFSSGNNNHFVNYTGNIAYYLNKDVFSLKHNKVHYFTCENATFKIDKNGFINWDGGKWLDGIFYGNFNNGVWYNGQFRMGQFNNSVCISGVFSNCIINNSLIQNKYITTKIIGD